MTPKNVYCTRLSVDACRQMLLHATRRDTAVATIFFGHERGKLYLVLSGERFRLYGHSEKSRARTGVYFYGRIDATPHGATITGRFRWHWFERIFLAVWFGIMVPAWCLIVPASVVYLVTSRTRDVQAGLAGIFGPTIILAGGCALVALKRWQEEPDRAFVVDFIARTLKAEPATGEVTGQKHRNAQD